MVYHHTIIQQIYSNYFDYLLNNKEPIENCIKLQDVFKLFISMGLTDLEKTVPFLARKPSFHTNIKVTLHFRNNIGLKDSLDTTEYRVYNKNSKFNILHAQKSANFLQKKTKKALLSLIETSIRFDLNI